MVFQMFTGPIGRHPHNYSDVLTQFAPEQFGWVWHTFRDIFAISFFSPLLVCLLFAAVCATLLIQKKHHEFEVVLGALSGSFLLVLAVEAAHQAAYHSPALRVGMYTLPALFIVLGAFFYGLAKCDFSPPLKTALLAGTALILGFVHLGQAREYYGLATSEAGHLRVATRDNLARAPKELADYEKFKACLRRYNLAEGRDYEVLTFKLVPPGPIL
jgi:hypothetical protein